MDEVEIGYIPRTYAQAWEGGDGVNVNGVGLVTALLIAFVAVIAYKVLF